MLDWNIKETYMEILNEQSTQNKGWLEQDETWYSAWESLEIKQCWHCHCRCEALSCKSLQKSGMYAGERDAVRCKAMSILDLELTTY